MRNVKVVVVGDGAVGKTCALISFSMNSFPGDYVPTVFDNYSANLMHNGQPFCLGLWDTAGQEDYDALRPLSYPQTDVFLVCYSIISRASFSNVETKWWPELKHYAPGTPAVLVATKADLRDNEEVCERLARRKEVPVTMEEGQKMADALGMDGFAQISALTQEGLQEAMRKAIDAAMMPRKKKTTARNDKCSIL